MLFKLTFLMWLLWCSWKIWPCKLSDGIVPGSQMTSGHWKHVCHAPPRRPQHFSFSHCVKGHSTNHHFTWHNIRVSRSYLRVVNEGVLNNGISPWLVWLSELSAGLQTKGSPIQFPVRAHAWVEGQVPSRGCLRGNHTVMFLSLSFSLLPLP